MTCVVHCHHHVQNTLRYLAKGKLQITFQYITCNWPVKLTIVNYIHCRKAKFNNYIVYYFYANNTHLKIFGCHAEDTVGGLK